MVKIYISEIQVMKLLNQGLVLLGYPDDIEVHCHVANNNKPHYYFNYTDDCGNQYLKNFGTRDAINIIQNMMMINRCEKCDIGVEVNNRNVSYFVKMNTITNSKKRIKKR